MVNLDDSNVRMRLDPLLSASEDAQRVSRVAPPNRSATLARVIEADIIPRLLLASGRQLGAEAMATLHADEQDIDDFARMMIGLDLAKANLVVSGALARGVALETVLLKLFAPTAQRLGAMWDDDRCSFTDVTVALCALQSLLRSFACGDIVEPSVLHDRSALMAAGPTEQHTFGVLILETFFRRAGWDVVGMPLASREEVLACVSRKPFSVVGFSMSRESGAPALRDLITSVRAASADPRIVVMVGGRIFNDTPDLVDFVGADLTASNADEALVASQHILCSRVRTH